MALTKLQSVGIQTTDTDYSISTNNTVAVYVNSSQNVGIGTSTPVQKLQVSSTGDNVILSSGGSGAAGYIVANGNGRSGLTGGLIALSYSGGTAEITNKSNAALIIGTNDIERMRIDASGRVTLPYQPCFSVNKTTSTTSVGVIIYDSVRFNTGSHYSTTTGRFTAPVAGKYMFSMYGVPTNQNSINLVLQKNGGSGGNVWINNGNTGGDAGTSVAVIIDLAANDYVNAYLNGGQMRQSNGDNNGFYGYLIG